MGTGVSGKCRHKRVMCLQPSARAVHGHCLPAWPLFCCLDGLLSVGGTVQAAAGPSALRRWPSSGGDWVTPALTEQARPWSVSLSYKYTFESENQTLPTQQPALPRGSARGGGQALPAQHGLLSRASRVETENN